MKIGISILIDISPLRNSKLANFLIIITEG